jgi:hypothetical protein
MLDFFKFLFLQCDETRKLMSKMSTPTSTTANFSLQHVYACTSTYTVKHEQKMAIKQTLLFHIVVPIPTTHGQWF